MAKSLSKSSKRAIAIVAVLVLLISFLFAMYETEGFTNMDPYHWGKHVYDDNGICIKCGEAKPDDVQKDEQEAANAVGGMVMDDNVIGNGIMLMGYEIPRALYAEYDIAPIAETAKQLTARITPDDATDQKVNWSVAWKNAGSTWANGKSVTDYVTVTATADGALTANVACIKAFSEQIIVTCTSRDNPEASATCTVDYIKRVSNVTLSVSGDATNVAGMPMVKLGGSITIKYTVSYTDGTLTGTFRGGCITTKLADNLFNNAKKAVTNTTNVVFKQEVTTVFANADLSSTSSATVTLGDVYSFIQINGNPGTVKSQWSKAIYDFCNTNKSVAHASFSMPYDYAYNGQATASGTAKVDIMFNSTSIAVAVGDVQLDNSGLIF